MSQWNFCPKVQYPAADVKQQINLMIDLKATKPCGSLFVSLFGFVWLVFCFVYNEANSLP